MNRRELITLVGGAATWPVVARAQQVERVRRIGVLISLASNDSEGQTRIAAFVQGLQQAGWTVGRNLQIEFRWAAGRVDDHRKLAMELIALKPEVILATGSAATAPLHAVSTVPVVFVNVIDPVCRKPSATRRQRHRLHVVAFAGARPMMPTGLREQTAGGQPTNFQLMSEKGQSLHFGRPAMSCPPQKPTCRVATRCARRRLTAAENGVVIRSPRR